MVGIQSLRCTLIQQEILERRLGLGLRRGLDQQVAQPRSPALQAKLVNDVSAVPVPATVLRQTDGLSAYLDSKSLIPLPSRGSDTALDSRQLFSYLDDVESEQVQASATPHRAPGALQHAMMDAAEGGAGASLACTSERGHRALQVLKVQGGVMASAAPHNGLAPNKTEQWQFFNGEFAWQPDVAIVGNGRPAASFSATASVKVKARPPLRLATQDASKLRRRTGERRYPPPEFLLMVKLRFLPSARLSERQREVTFRFRTTTTEMTTWNESVRSWQSGHFPALEPSTPEALGESRHLVVSVSKTANKKAKKDRGRLLLVQGCGAEPAAYLAPTVHHELMIWCSRSQPQVQLLVVAVYSDTSKRSSQKSSKGARKRGTELFDASVRLLEPLVEENKAKANALVLAACEALASAAGAEPCVRRIREEEDTPAFPMLQNYWAATRSYGRRILLDFEVKQDGLILVSLPRPPKKVLLVREVQLMQYASIAPGATEAKTRPPPGRQSSGFLSSGSVPSLVRSTTPTERPPAQIEAFCKSSLEHLVNIGRPTAVDYVWHTFKPLALDIPTPSRSSKTRKKIGLPMISWAEQKEGAGFQRPRGFACSTLGMRALKGRPGGRPAARRSRTEPLVMSFDLKHAKTAAPERVLEGMVQDCLLTSPQLTSPPHFAPVMPHEPPPRQGGLLLRGFPVKARPPLSRRDLRGIYALKWLRLCGVLVPPAPQGAARKAAVATRASILSGPAPAAPSEGARPASTSYLRDGCLTTDAAFLASSGDWTVKAPDELDLLLLALPSAKLFRKMQKNAARKRPKERRISRKVMWEPTVAPAVLLESPVQPGCPTLLRSSCTAFLPKTRGRLGQTNAGSSLKKCVIPCEKQGSVPLVTSAPQQSDQKPSLPAKPLPTQPLPTKASISALSRTAAPLKRAWATAHLIALPLMSAIRTTFPTSGEVQKVQEPWTKLSFHPRRTPPTPRPPTTAAPEEAASSHELSAVAEFTQMLKVNAVVAQSWAAPAKAVSSGLRYKPDNILTGGLETQSLKPLTAETLNCSSGKLPTSVASLPSHPASCQLLTSMRPPDLGVQHSLAWAALRGALEPMLPVSEPLDEEMEPLAPTSTRWQSRPDAGRWYPLALGPLDSVEETSEERRDASPQAPLEGADGPGNFICGFSGAVAMSKSQHCRLPNLDSLEEAVIWQTIVMEAQWAAGTSRPGQSTVQVMSRLLAKVPASRVVMLGMSFGCVPATGCTELIEMSVREGVRSVVLWDPRIPPSYVLRPLGFEERRKAEPEVFWPDNSFPRWRLQAPGLMLSVGFLDEEDRTDVVRDYGLQSTTALTYETLQQASLQDSWHMSTYFSDAWDLSRLLQFADSGLPPTSGPSTDRGPGSRQLFRPAAARRSEPSAR